MKGTWSAGGVAGSNPRPPCTPCATGFTTWDIRGASADACKCARVLGILQQCEQPGRRQLCAMDDGWHGRMLATHARSCAPRCGVGHVVLPLPARAMNSLRQQGVPERAPWCRRAAHPDCLCSKGFLHRRVALAAAAPPPLRARAQTAAQATAGTCAPSAPRATGQTGAACCTPRMPAPSACLARRRLALGRRPGTSAPEGRREPGRALSRGRRKVRPAESDARSMATRRARLGPAIGAEPSLRGAGRARVGLAAMHVARC